MAFGDKQTILSHARGFGSHDSNQFVLTAPPPGKTIRVVSQLPLARMQDPETKQELQLWQFLPQAKRWAFVRGAGFQGDPSHDENTVFAMEIEGEFFGHQLKVILAKSSVEEATLKIQEGAED